MAQTKILGEAAVITSEFSLEDLKTVAKYRPEALVLRGGEDGKEPIFAIAVSDVGTINEYGVTFNAVTHDEEKKAQLTMRFIVPQNDDPKEALAELIGGALLNLNKLEDTLSDVIDEINDEKERALSAIEVVQ